MHKISDKIINSISNAIPDRRVELRAGGMKVKIQRGVFHGGSHSTLLFVIVMIPVNEVFRKCTFRGNKSTKFQEKSYHLKYMDDIKVLAKNEKELET